MTILFRRRRPVAGSAAAAVLILGLVVFALQLSSTAKADRQFLCRPGDEGPHGVCDRVGGIGAIRTWCW